MKRNKYKMIMCHRDVTDWNQYYKKKSKISTFTQRITQTKLIELLYKYSFKEHLNVVELGGANSCFADAIIRSFRVNKYTIVDNSDVGIEKFNIEWKEKNVDTEAIKCDLSHQKLVLSKYGLCYSVGLIEHFNKEETKKVIEQHFNCVEVGGIVIISYPTPTVKYRIIRTIMEIFHVWNFPDERPLRLNEILPVISKHGQVLEVFQNKKLPLTQQICVVRKQ